VGSPKGWPKGISAQDYCDAILDSKRAEMLIKIDAGITDDIEGVDPSVEQSESVAALRRSVGQQG